MKLLTIDPSSTCTGYALLRSARELCEAGLLRQAGGPAAEFPGTAAGAPPALQRIEGMAADLAKLIEEQRSDRVLLEIPSGHVGRRHRGGGAGLAVYGMAVGVLYATAVMRMAPGAVEVVDENTWTASVPKRRRQRAVALQFPAYAEQLARDRGGDMADAIALAVWWFDQKSKVQGPKSKVQGPGLNRMENGE